MTFPFFYDRQWRKYKRRQRIKKALNFALLASFCVLGLMGLLWLTQPDRINAAAGVGPQQPLLPEVAHTQRI